VLENALTQKSIFSKTRESVLKKTKGHYEAPIRILDLLESSLGDSRSIYLEKEAQLLGEIAVAMWGLPPFVRDVIHHHDKKVFRRESLKQQPLSILETVTAAIQLSHLINLDLDQADMSLINLFKQRVGLSDTQLKKLVESLRPFKETASAVLAEVAAASRALATVPDLRILFLDATEAGKNDQPARDLQRRLRCERMLLSRLVRTGRDPAAALTQALHHPPRR